MPDQRSVMKEFRFLDEKRLAAGLSPAEEARHGQLRALIGPEMGAGGLKSGFDVNAAAARLRDSLLPAGLRNRPPPTPAPAPEPELPDTDPLAAAYAAAPFAALEEPAALEPGGLDTLFDPATLGLDAPEAAPGYDPNAYAIGPDGQPYDPNAYAIGPDGQPYDPNAYAVGPDGQPYDPNAYAVGPDGQPYDPNAYAVGPDGQPYDPNAYAVGPDGQPYDPNAYAVGPDGQPYDPNAYAVGPDGQPYDPNAQPYDAPSTPAASEESWAADGAWDPAALAEEPALPADPPDPAVTTAPALGDYDAAAWDNPAPASEEAFSIAADAATPEATGMLDLGDPCAEPTGMLDLAADLGADPTGMADPGAEPTEMLGLASETAAEPTAMLGLPAPDALESLLPFDAAAEAAFGPDALPPGFEPPPGGEYDDTAGFGGHTSYAPQPAQGDAASTDAFQAAQAVSPPDGGAWHADAAFDAGFQQESSGSFALDTGAQGAWGAAEDATPWDAAPEAEAAPADAAEPEIVEELPTIDGEEILEEIMEEEAPPALELQPPEPEAVPEPEPEPAPAPAVAASVVAGTHRVVVHTIEGQVKRGVLDGADLGAAALALGAQPGGTAEVVPVEKVKAIFFMLTPGEPAPAAEGKKVRVTFRDGRQVAGLSPDYRDDGIGFFMVPADTRTNTGRIWVYRAAVKDVAVS